METYEHLKKRNQNEKLFFKDTVCPDGTVFTPDHVADHLVLMALERFCIQKGFLDIKSIKKEQWLSFKVLDMTVGTGQLLLAYLKVLEPILTAQELIAVVKENLYAIDIDRKSMEAFVEALSVKYAVDLSLEMLHFYVEDALCLNLDVQFDLILGNPPYIGEKGHRELFQKVRQTDLGKKYYEGKMDYFYFFIYKGYSWLKDDGVQCFVTTNYFLTADGASKLRMFLKEEFFLSDFTNYEDLDAFRGRKLHACLYALTKIKPDKITIRDEQIKPVFDIQYTEAFDAFNAIRWVQNQEERELLCKMQFKAQYRLGEVFEVHQGIVSGLDRVDKDPCFVFNREEFETLTEDEKKALKPFYKNSQIKHYQHEDKPNFFLLYTNDYKPPSWVLQHLAPYKVQLEQRREVIKRTRTWYQITWPRKQSIFEGEKLVAPQRAVDNYFAFSEGDFYASADVYFIKKTEKAPYSLKTLCGILNTKAYRLWLSYYGKKKGSLLELYATPLKQIPLLPLTDSACRAIEESVDKLIKNPNQIDEIDKIEILVSKLIEME